MNGAQLTLNYNAGWSGRVYTQHDFSEFPRGNPCLKNKERSNILLLVGTLVSGTQLEL